MLFDISTFTLLILSLSTQVYIRDAARSVERNFRPEVFDNVFLLNKLSPRDKTETSSVLVAILS